MTSLISIDKTFHLPSSVNFVNGKKKIELSFGEQCLCAALWIRLANTFTPLANYYAIAQDVNDNTFFEFKDVFIVKITYSNVTH